ncbi:hypothetical protein P3T37_005028 [Kitasatospora sp. MAA4]|uniref:helix-turn-helix domain-containing protein n=1 Tax=Kitasatospora sp. MAA4 TaxID=3035093 RepID=UPI002475EA9D|nr:helix-turn-helix transcriptional regulator [Kitasatospora sp. MAA4]MDH6135612.1 hypothetical protein [Kitasatospora sp. MAA4]
MARRPRPIDPTDGPLPAFAYDLRTVREEAGNPTYRALAGLAGFSATTLSDAAGGVRQPSLEVTLAYVGACGGDVTLWESRWRELDRLLASEREQPADAPEAEAEPIPEAEPAAAIPVAAPVTEPDPQPKAQESANGVFRIESPVGNDDEKPAARTGRRRWAPWAAVAAVVLLVASALVIGRLPGKAHPAPARATKAATPAVPCPVSTPAPGAFSGSTYTIKTNVRAGANLNAAVVQEVPIGCTLYFSGYCLGDVAVDAFQGDADMRWLELTGGGVVASAVIHGNPPSSMAPTPCTDSVPTPTTLSLAVNPGQDGDPDTVDLLATGPHLWIAGFAAYYASTGGGSDTAPQWHQLGFTDKTVLSAEWRFGPLRGDPANPGPIPVVAVSCMAGQAPNDVIDARLFQPTAPTASQPTTLSPADRVKAEQTACGYFRP